MPRGVFISALILASGLALAGQCRQLDDGGAHPAAAVPIQARATRLELGGVGHDHLELNISIALTAARAVTLRRVVVEGLKVNGLPVYAAPLATEIKTVAGRELALPEPLHLDVYYRDLDTLQPLLTLVRDQQAHLTGNLIATVELNLPARLLLQTGQVQAPMSFSADVPVEAPGGPTARLAALAALTAADAVLSRAQGGAGSLLALGTAHRRAVLARAPALYAVATRFQLLEKKTPVAAFACQALGWQVSADSVLTLKSALQPWKYDAEIAAEMDTRHLSLGPDYDVTLTPLAGGDSASLANHGLALAPALKDDAASAYVPGADGKITHAHLNAQVSPLNLARLVLNRPAPPGAAMAWDESAPAAGWDSLAAFRLAGAGPPRADPVFLAAHPAQNLVLLAAPLDFSGWGSPLVGADGIVGIVLDETHVLPAAAVRAAFGF